MRSERGRSGWSGYGLGLVDWRRSAPASVSVAAAPPFGARHEQAGGITARPAMRSCRLESVRASARRLGTCSTQLPVDGATVIASSPAACSAVVVDVEQRLAQRLLHKVKHRRQLIRLRSDVERGAVPARAIALLGESRGRPVLRFHPDSLARPVRVA
jgi:hypothetical protein